MRRRIRQREIREEADNVPRRRTVARARLQKVNRRLREKLHSYRVAVAGLAVALVATLALFGFAALNEPEPEPVPLGTGRALVSIGDTLQVRPEEGLPDAVAPRGAPEARAEKESPADDGEAGRPAGEGTASYYGRELAGQPTATGERFNPEGLTAAHRTLPFGSRVRVTNVRNGESVVVRINDRGPFTGGRAIDLSYAAAREIGLLRSGTAQVRMELL